MKNRLATAAVAVIVVAAIGMVAMHALRAGTHTPGARPSQAHAAPDGTELGQAQPDAVSQLFASALTAPDGSPGELAPFKGQVLVVNFWASWCAPCVREMPALSGLARQYADKGVKFVGIGVDSQKNVEAFLRKVPVDYPIFVSGFGGADIARRFGNTAGGLPFTVVIDANGTVRSTKLGEITSAELRRALDAI